MTLAYLILAHKNPDQLFRLVRALDSVESIFLIHVDTKAPINSFLKKFESFMPGKVLFCPNRKKVMWGSYSMIETTMTLIHFLFKMRIKADYVHLISGQDYPIQSNKEISNFFRKNKGKNFLEFFSLPNKRWREMGMNRIHYHWGMNEHNNIFYNNLDYKHMYPTNYLPENITPYGGSQWWSLHIDCAHFLLEEYLKNNPLFSFFKFSFIPDEMLFQTLILNSVFKDTVVNDNLRFIKWLNYMPHPETIGSNHFNSLISEGKLYARKFEPTCSQILDQLDLFRKE